MIDKTFADMLGYTYKSSHSTFVVVGQINKNIVVIKMLNRPNYISRVSPELGKSYARVSKGSIKDYPRVLDPDASLNIMEIIRIHLIINEINGPRGF